MTRRKALTEAAWLESSSPNALLVYLQQHRKISRLPGSRRRLRLFVCACCRRLWHLFTDEASRQAVEVSERFADGLARRAELTAAHKAAEVVVRKAQEAMHAAATARPGQPVSADLLLPWGVTT